MEQIWAYRAYDGKIFEEEEDCEEYEVKAIGKELSNNFKMFDVNLKEIPMTCENLSDAEKIEYVYIKNIEKNDDLLEIIGERYDIWMPQEEGLFRFTNRSSFIWKKIDLAVLEQFYNFARNLLSKDTIS